MKMYNLNKISYKRQLYDFETKCSKPKLIGLTSVKRSGEMVDNLSELKYLVKRAGPTDLNLTRGKDDFQTETNYDHVFQYLSKHKEIVSEFEGSSMKDVGFVASRNFLTEIGQIPYNPAEKFFSANLVNGAIYLYEPCSYSPIWNPQGIRFRQNLLSSSATSQPDIDKPLETHESLRSFFKLNLYNHNILYDTFIEGILANEKKYQSDIAKDLDEKSAIDELATRKIVKFVTYGQKNDQTNTFRIHRTRNLWFKCLLSNAEEVYVGFKNESGNVHEIKSYSIEELENMGKEYWKSNVMFNFMNKVLTYIKNCFVLRIPNDRDIKMVPNMKLYFKFFPREGFKQCKQPADEKFSLPEWYVNLKMKK